MFHVKVKGVSSAEWIVEDVSQNPERGVRGKKMARHFNMEPVGHSHRLFFLGHGNVKSGFFFFWIVHV